MEMQFRKDTTVVTADGHEAGHVDRVVVNPQSKIVTHLIVRRGALFTEDKVVPIGMVEARPGDRLRLRLDRDALRDLPDFRETYVVPADETADGAEAVDRALAASPWYWYTPVVGFRPPVYPVVAPVETEVQTNVPEGTVALKEGARVISFDDQEMGDVEQVVMDSATGRATHFVVAQGRLLKTRKLVPAEWVSEMDEREVRLTVSARLLEHLPAFEYTEEPEG